MKATADTRTNGWRIAGWTVLAVLLALPAIAMRFTTEVVWTASDFIFAAAMLGALGLGFELLMRTVPARGRRLGLALVLIALFLAIWVELAVGIID